MIFSNICKGLKYFIKKSYASREIRVPTLVLNSSESLVKLTSMIDPVHRGQRVWSKGVRGRFSSFSLVDFACFCLKLLGCDAECGPRG